MIKIHPIKRVLCIAGLLVLALLNACGPGTGGTGVGPPPIASTTIANGSIVYSNPSTTAVNPPPTPGPDLATCNTNVISLQLQAMRIAAATNCLSFNFTGAWQINADGIATVQGNLQTSASPTGAASSQAAFLELRYPIADINSTSLILTIRDTSGAIVLGPVTLQKAPG